MVIKNDSSNKSLEKKKGVGPIIVSVFMVIILILGYSVFQLVFFKTTEFSKTLEESQQLTFEREKEDITVLGNPFKKNDRLNVTFVNTGEVVTSIKWITVIDPSKENQLFGYKKIEPPLTLKPEETSAPINGKAEWVFPGGHDEKKEYLIQAVTTRGQTFNYQYPNPERDPIKGETKHLVIGPFVFNFTSTSFTYTSEDKETPQPGYEIMDNETNITFYVKIKNHHNESMEINDYSYMLLVIQEQDTQEPSFHESELYFYIVNDTSTQNDLDRYDSNHPIVIASNQIATLKFASKTPLGNDFNDGECLQGISPHDNDAGTENLITTFLVLFWEYGESGEVMGQTIPFVAIHIPNYNSE